MPFASAVRQIADEPGMLGFAAECAKVFRGGALVYLEGDLGAGKTTLARGVLRALGCVGPVKSPTYTLLEPYELGGLCVYHCDFYRLSDSAELEFLGLRDLLAPEALFLIEWPERGEGWLPAPDLRIRIRISGGGRLLELSGETARSELLLRQLRN